MRRAVAALILLLITGSAHALVVQNVVQNAHFDTNLSGWVLSSDPAAFGVTVAWQAADGIGSGRSGSLRANGSQSFTTSYEIMTQCVALAPSPGAQYDLSLRTRHQNIPAHTEIAAAEYFSGPSCTGTLVGSFEVDTSSSTNNVWQIEHHLNASGASAQSARVSLLGQETTGVPTRLEYDDVYFGLAAPSSCTPGTGVLCVNDAPGDARFRIFGSYSTAQGGGSTGGLHAIDLSSLGVAHGGLMWFFAADNPELLVKVLNACTLNGRYWVFISAGTNVGVELFTEDTHTGAVVDDHNPDISPFPAVQDIYALPCS
ncbi:MAG: hypothetical protein ACM3OB_03525 [Acidobacteriota bacterium]